MTKDCDRCGRPSESPDKVFGIGPGFSEPRDAIICQDCLDVMFTGEREFWDCKWHSSTLGGEE